LTMSINKQQIITYLSENFRIEESELDETTSLFSSRILDSFSMVELVTFIEETAGIKFGVLELNLENLDTIQNIIRFVEKKTG
jgi:acyl carrier protein